MKQRETLSDNPVIEQQPLCVSDFSLKTDGEAHWESLNTFPVLPSRIFTSTSGNEEVSRSPLSSHDSPTLLLGVPEWGQTLQLTFTPLHANDLLRPWWAADTKQNDVVDDGKQVNGIESVQKGGN